MRPASCRFVTIAATSGAVLTALVTTMAQRPACEEGLVRARTLAGRFQTAEAIAALDATAKAGCDVSASLTYLRGLLAAQAAATKGGDNESLEPVRAAAATLEAEGPSGGPAEISSLILRAAAAAAQSERDEMAVFLAQALQLERARGARGASGAPVLSAHDVAGELWLQVHRYDEAAAAFLVARAVGTSPRVAVGLARARARDKRVSEACDAYRDVEEVAAAIPGVMKAELAEARAFLGQPSCRPSIRR